MAFIKPNVNTIWAETGDVIEPVPAKVAQGWISEIPEWEFENWIQNRQDQFNAHVNQYGIPVWDATTEYIAGKSYAQGTDGIIYKAKETHTNSDPSNGLNTINWEVPFSQFNISYSKTESDTLYIKKANNLSDVSSVSGARNNLSVYSKGETDTRYEQLAHIIGMVAPFATQTAPTGWLACNGSAISRTVYSGLFSRIGITYGAGDGLDTFNLPDLRGEFIRGWDDGRGVDTGRTFGSSQTDELKSHGHTGSSGTAGSHGHTGSTFSAGTHSHNTVVNQVVSTSGASDLSATRSMVKTNSNLGLNAEYILYGSSATPSLSPTNSSGSHSHTLDIDTGGAHTHTVTVNNTGGAETRPRNIAMMYCIKT